RLGWRVCRVGGGAGVCGVGGGVLEGGEGRGGLRRVSRREMSSAKARSGAALIHPLRSKASMLGFGRTLKQAYRSVRGSKSTSVAVILTLSLGIGVTTAVFSIVYAVLLPPLPYPESDRLVRVWLNNPRQGIEKDVTSYPNFVDWRAQSRSIEGMAAVAPARRNLTG